MPPPWHNPTKTVGDLTLPVLGLGTIKIGDRTRPGALATDEADVEFLRWAIETQGITHLDTAVRYGSPRDTGRSETLIGQAIRHLDRTRLTIATKILPEHFQGGDFYEAVMQSITRLGTTPDLVYLHEPNPDVPLVETFKAVQFSLEQQCFRLFGLSKFTGRTLIDALALAKQIDLPVSACQFRFNLGRREHVDDSTLATCQANHIMVVAYRPLFEGRVIEGARLQLIAERYDATYAQIALRWVIGKPGVVTIVGTTDRQHLDENCQLLSQRLSARDEQQLDHHFPKLDEYPLGESQTINNEGNALNG